MRFGLLVGVWRGRMLHIAGLSGHDLLRLVDLVRFLAILQDAMVLLIVLKAERWLLHILEADLIV